MTRRGNRSPRVAAVDLAKTLAEAGFTAWFAGGCVRDELLGRTPKDWDIATNATPEQVRQLFPRARSVGESFGVMLVLRHNHPIEIATFRSDGTYSDGRRPDAVTFAGPQEDAQRRDFTINGLFQDPHTGEIYDFVGGVADLEARCLRAIGEAQDRFMEDDLRMLRAVRFAAALDLAVDPKTEAAILARSGNLAGVSRERIGDEIRRMFSHASRVRAATLIQAWSLDNAIFADQGAGELWPRLNSLGADVDFPAVLAAWALDRAVSQGTAEELVGQWRSSLLLTNAETNGMRACLDVLARSQDWPSLDTAGQKRLAANDWFEPARLMLRCVQADLVNEIDRDLIVLRQSGLAPERLIGGDDLLANGHMAGPDLGRVLESVYDAQLRGEIESKNEALDLARRLAGLSEAP